MEARIPSTAEFTTTRYNILNPNPREMANISIRESIRWLPDEASEPTSTIVLTSPSHRFVDLRITHSNKSNSAVEEGK